MKEDIRLASPDLLSAIRDLFHSLAPRWSVCDDSVDSMGQSTSDPRVQLLAVLALVTSPLYAF